MAIYASTQLQKADIRLVVLIVPGPAKYSNASPIHLSIDVFMSYLQYLRARYVGRGCIVDPIHCTICLSDWCWLKPDSSIEYQISLPQFSCRISLCATAFFFSNVLFPSRLFGADSLTDYIAIRPGSICSIHGTDLTTLSVPIK